MRCVYRAKLGTQNSRLLLQLVCLRWRGSGGVKPLKISGQRADFKSPLFRTGQSPIRAPGFPTGSGRRLGGWLTSRRLPLC